MIPLGLLGVLLVVAIPLVALAQRRRIPYPIVLVLGGLPLGYFAHFARFHADPHEVLLAFLPPLLFAEALGAPLDVMRRRIVLIAGLAIGLVLVTAGAVAGVVQVIAPWMTLPAAVLLGAIVSPTDAVAAAPVLARLGVAQKTLAIVKGESLLNDAVALVLYAAAFSAAGAGHFSGRAIGIELFLAIFLSPLIGAAFAVAAALAWRRIKTPHLQTAISIILPWVAYMAADYVHASGVVAVVTAGFVVSARGQRDMLPAARLISTGFWETSIFIVNAIVFVLVGVALHSAFVAFREYHQSLVLIASVILTVLLTRYAWVALQTLAFQLAGRKVDWRESTIVAWCGMRGGVSAALALALPTLLGDRSFIARDTVVLVTFAVIFVTLVGQGSTLPWLLRKLGARSPSAPETGRTIVATESPIMHGHLEYFDAAAIAAERALYVAVRNRDEIDDAELNRIQFAFDLIQSGRRLMLEGKSLDDEDV
ncbi:MAG: cation:proton antiporter [Vulcanimicrobiaceae bacterium]